MPAKLLCYQGGVPESHVRDFAGILATGLVEVVRDYLDRSAGGLGVAKEWRAIRDRLGIQ